MYECPNCTANLKFSIEKQQLYCESCKTEMDPYAFKKKKDAVEGKYFKIDVFTCPQCGAVHDRDINAAINILNEGLRLLNVV